MYRSIWEYCLLKNITSSDPRTQNVFPLIQTFFKKDVWFLITPGSFPIQGIESEEKYEAILQQPSLGCAVGGKKCFESDTTLSFELNRITERDWDKIAPAPNIKGQLRKILYRMVNA